MSDWKLLPTETRLQPLANKKLDLVYQQLEENSRLSRLAWFYVALLVGTTIGVIALITPEDGGVSDAFGRAGLYALDGVTFIEICTLFFVIIFIAFSHMTAAALRNELRLFDFTSFEAELDSAKASKLAARAKGLDARLNFVRGVLLFDVLAIGLTLSICAGCMAYDAFSQFQERYKIDNSPLQPPPPPPS